MRLPISMLLGLFLVSGVGVLTGFAQEVTTAPVGAPAPVGSPSAVETPVPEIPVTDVKVVLADNGLVSLDFQDADIRNVLKVLAFKSGVNIVAGPDVSGVVTIQLNDVPWQKAMEVILSTYGYGYERKGNIITVMTVENLKKHREDALLLAGQEALVTKTFSLSFSKASDVVDSLNKVKTPRGSVNFDQRTNTLIITDTQSNLELITEVVKTLDSVTQQVLIEAKVVETTLTNTENLGIKWTVGGTISAAQIVTKFPFTGASNKFIPAMSSLTVVEEGDTFKYGTLDASGLAATLEMLSTRDNTNILSNPHIVTLDNQPAKIVVGDQFPIPQYTYNNEQAKLQVSGWEYKDIGIIFEVTPHVNNASLVTLDLHPTVTSITSSTVIESTTLPILSVEEANTKVMVENGKTLVIAGLIKDRTVTKNYKVPFLGDIPVLGHAFKKKDETKTKSELLIFLTPHIITAKSSPAAASSGK